MDSFASNSHLKEFQGHALEIIDNNKTITIKRFKSEKCGKQLIDVDLTFGGSYASQKVSSECKKTFITTLGLLQPMHLYKGVKTVAELEVLSHIKKVVQDSDKFILIDARTKEWYDQMTIPMSVNLPYNEIHSEDIEDMEDDEDIAEFNHMIKILGIVNSRGYLNFTRAKIALIFCNGSWCSQSSKFIMKLINMGYPEDKLLWYRGGVQDWLVSGFTVTKGK